MAAETFYEGGISSDLALQETTDGVRLVDLWGEVQTLLDEYNARRLLIEQFMGYVTTKPEADKVVQASAKWMRFGEHGRPDQYTKVSREIAVQTAVEGFAATLGWTNLAEILVLTSESIRGRVRAIIAEDARQRYRRLFERFYDNTAQTVVDVINQLPYTQNPFYNGDSEVPPTRGYKTFTAPHNHYLTCATNNAPTITEVDNVVKTVMEHGFTANPIIFCSEGDLTTIANITNSPFAPFQAMNRYVPSGDVNVNQASALMQISIGINPLFRAVGVWNGLATVMISQEAPSGYLAAFSAQGDLSQENPLQIREPEIPALQGLRQIRENIYPFVQTQYERFYGVSVRQRGNGAVLQLASGTYAAPVWPDTSF